MYGRPGKAFQVPPSQLEAHWAGVPTAADILISHMPPYGVCDTNSSGVRSGCRHLLTAVRERVRPRLHVFGHIHEGYGHKGEAATKLIVPFVFS